MNDCDPEFYGSLSGGITQGDSSGTRVFPMDVIQTFSFKIFISKGFLIDLIELDK